MEDRSVTMARIEASGVVAVVRAQSKVSLVDVAGALAAGGVIAVEITMTSPGALEGIAEIRRNASSDVLVGVGSVLDAETARAAILAGAQFIVAPTFDPQVIEIGHRYGLPVIPGAMTPTEILQAWSEGADAVKVFPANHFGPQYLKDLHGPMPQLKLTPTGGVDLTTVHDWIRAGAFAVGVGSALVQQELLVTANWNGLTDLARQYVEAVSKARATTSAT